MKRIRNFIRYLIILVLDIWIMITFHSYLNFLFLIGLIIMPIYSLMAVKTVANHLSLTVKMPHDAMYKKEEFKVKFLLKNETIFPILNATITMMIENPFYLDFGEHTLNVPLRMKQETIVEYPVVMDYCGRFSMSVSSIKLLDLLGIYEVKVPVSLEQECLVFPKGDINRQEAGEAYQRGVTEAMESKEKGYDFSDVSGIREYIPGDKLQNIHWKLSVKKDLLMVKERVSVSAMQLCVLVDLVNDEKMSLESILEYTDGITKAFVEMNLPFTIYYYSTKNSALKDFYIGNEVERKTAIEMMLYDRCYKTPGLIEDIYLKECGAGTYLYIGYCLENDSNQEDSVIQSDGNAIIELKTI